MWQTKLRNVVWIYYSSYQIDIKFTQLIISENHRYALNPRTFLLVVRHFLLIPLVVINYQKVISTKMTNDW